MAEEHNTSSTLDLLTSDRIEKAFKKTLEESEALADGNYVLITPDLYDAVQSVGNEGFSNREPLSQACGMTWEGPTAEEFWLPSLKQGFSIAIVDDDRNVLAIRVIRWQRIDVQPYDVSQIEVESARLMYSFMSYVDEQAKFSERFPTNEIFHLMGLVVRPQYTKRGYASKIMAFTLKFLKNLQLGKEIFIKGEATSNYSKKMFDKLGYTCVYDQPLDDYRVNGERVLKDTGEHTSIAIYGMCLQI